LGQGKLDKAESRLKPFGFSFQGSLTVPSQVSAEVYNNSAEHLYNNALRLLLQRGDAKSMKQAVDLADRLIQEAQERNYRQHVIERLLIRAQLHASLSDSRAGQADVKTALVLAEPENYITVFMEAGAQIGDMLPELLRKKETVPVSAVFVEKILAAFPQEAALMAASNAPSTVVLQGGLIEPLSKRELEILLLIGDGYSNQDIAEKLVVTLHTVKKHSSNIYGKLGVSSRTQAVARARQLNLL